MGWSGTQRLLWGDEPQDKVDSAVTRFKHFKVDSKKTTKAERVTVYNRLRASKPLRNAVNKIYRQEWDRGAKDNEFSNLLKVATGLGGRTVKWK